MFDEQLTETVELTRGYVDPDGKAHRIVTLRVPMIEDEVRADATMAELRTSSNPHDRAVGYSDSLHTLAMVKETILSWDGIADVRLEHLRQLKRKDAARLIAAFYALEEKDERRAAELLAQKGNPEGNSESG